MIDYCVFYQKNCFMKNSYLIFYEKVFYIYKKIVLSKVDLTFERKFEYLWDFFNCASGQVDH